MNSPEPATLSIVIPTIDETHSLMETVQTVLSDERLTVLEVLLVICDQTAAATRRACRHLEKEHAGRIRIVTQSLPRLGGAFTAGVAVARGTHLVLMFADLESDPRLVADLAAASRMHPEAIISASRWLEGGGFHGYGPVKLVLNRCFQSLCASLCRCRLTDFTYGYRLYPATILKDNIWTQCGHPYVLETIVRPVLAGIPVFEIPAVWMCRQEGQKRSRFTQYSRYLPALLGMLLDRRSVNTIIRPQLSDHQRPSSPTRLKLPGR